MTYPIVPTPVHASVTPTLILREPLHSSLQYPRVSTPRKSQTESMREVDEYIADCVRQLVFADGRDITVVSDNSSLLDSGYSSLPRISVDPKDSSSSSTSSSDSGDQNSKCAINNTVDSDSTAFFEIPMTKRPVTHKVERRSSIKKHLKYIGKIGKKIQRHRDDHVLNTLAVL